MPPLTANGILHAATLDRLEGVVHAFSGELRSAGAELEFARDAALSHLPLVRLRQVHGDSVVYAPAVLGATQPPAGDALVSDRPDITLAVATADCVPLLLVDPGPPVVAAVHAGWRGLLARVVLRAVEAMTALGADPAQMAAAIGPAVQASCYRVGPEVQAAFSGGFPETRGLFRDGNLDLVTGTASDLARAGVRAEAISTIAICTHCHANFASFRRQGHARGTNLSAIAIRTTVRSAFGDVPEPNQGLQNLPSGSERGLP